MISDILTMLNPKTQSISDILGGFGGLTPQDLALALSGLGEGPLNLGLAKHGDPEARRILTSELIAAILPNISASKPRYAKILADIAIHEEIGNNCLNCAGRGFKYRPIETPDEAQDTDDNGLLPVPCESPGCVDGKYKMTEQERGELIAEAIDETYTRNKWKYWAWDYAGALSQLADWNNDLEAHLWKRLGDK